MTNHGTVIHRTWALATLWAACLAPPTSALAQTSTSAPLTPTFEQGAPAAPGMINLDNSQPSYTLDRTVHGYLTTGILTGGGRGVAGGVLVPVVPGVVTLEAGGGTGQTAVQGFGPDGKSGRARSSTYYAALHVRPSQDVQIDVAVSGSSLHLPGGTGFIGP